MVGLGVLRVGSAGQCFPSCHSQSWLLAKDAHFCNESQFWGKWICAEIVFLDRASTVDLLEGTVEYPVCYSLLYPS